MLELLFLLYLLPPLTAGRPWGAEVHNSPNRIDASRLSRDYVAGVNFLLSNQQDKAVDLVPLIC